MPSDRVDSCRLRSSYSLQELLSDDILGETPRTHEKRSRLIGSDIDTETPVRIMAFGGVARSFPFFKTSMVLTAVITMYALQFLQPIGSVEVSDSKELAMFPPTETVSSHPPLLPAQRRLQNRLERMHGAAEATASASIAPASTPKPIVRSDNKRGIFLTAASVAREKFFNDTVDALLAAGSNAIVFDVKGGGVLFHSAAPMATEIGLVRNLYDLPQILAKLHEKNIYVIGRFVAIKDEAFTAKKPDTRIKHPTTGKVLNQTWVDPSNDEAIAYNMQVVCELAAAGIDEINLDYIRFSTAEFGALGVFSGQEKADRVEKFIKATRETIDRCGPKTKLGLSTYAILGWDYDINVATLGQDVRRFAPLVDVISPMAYPATFTSDGYYVPGKNPGPRMYWLVYRTLTGYSTLLGPDQSQKIRPWIQGYSVGNKDVSDQIRAVYDAGFCGYQVWNAANNYAPSYVALSKDTVRPDRCIDEPKL